MPPVDKRDPKLTPKSGDVLRLDRREIEVDRVTRQHVVYGVTNVEGMAVCMPVADWASFVKNARVIRKA